MFKLKSLITAVAFVAFLPMPAAMASIITFDDWTPDPFGIGGLGAPNAFKPGTPYFESGSNFLSLGFSNIVFPPSTRTYQGSSLNYYYTTPMDLQVSSPTFNVVAGHLYTISFNVDIAQYQSSANQNAQSPNVVLNYLGPGSGAKCHSVLFLQRLAQVD